MKFKLLLLFVFVLSFLTFSCKAIAECFISPGEPELSIEKENIKIDSLTGVAVREYEAIVSIGNEVVCDDDTIDCENGLSVNINTGLFNVENFAVCEDNGDFVSIPKMSGISICDRKYEGSNDLRVSHKIKLLPGARYVANYSIDSKYSSNCIKVNEAFWDWSRVCGSTNFIDIPPSIDDVLIIGMDVSDIENPFIGQMNTLTVGKSSRLAVNSSQYNRDSSIVQVWKIKGSGIDIEREVSYIDDIVDFENIKPTQTGKVVVTVEMKGFIRRYKEPLCDLGEKEHWSLTSEPFVIDVIEQSILKKENDNESQQLGCSTTSSSNLYSCLFLVFFVLVLNGLSFFNKKVLMK